MLVFGRLCDRHRRLLHVVVVTTASTSTHPASATNAAAAARTSASVGAVCGEHVIWQCLDVLDVDPGNEVDVVRHEPVTIIVTMLCSAYSAMQTTQLETTVVR